MPLGCYAGGMTDSPTDDPEFQRLMAMTDAELTATQVASLRNNPPHMKVSEVINLKREATQAQSAQAMTDATAELVAATKRLVQATWGLVGLTAVLAIVAVFTVLLT